MQKTKGAAPTPEKRSASLRVQNMHLPSHICLAVWSLIVLFPIYVMIMNSFKTKRTIFVAPFAPPAVWNTANYTGIFQSRDFLGYFKNSLVVVVISLALVLILGSLAAYAFANWKGRTSGSLFFFIIAGMMLPIKIGSIRLLELVIGLRLGNTIWSLPPVYLAMGIPIAVFILTEFIREVPHELIEAGFVDGAGHARIFSTVILPLLRPALATVAIYNLVPFWNDLWFPLIFIGNVESQKTLLLGVTRLFGQYEQDWSQILAVLTLSAVPVILLYLLMSKQFIRGMTAGAVKG